jgi:hypothetical protein
MAVMNLVVGCNESSTPAGSVERKAVINNKSAATAGERSTEPLDVVVDGMTVHLQRAYFTEPDVSARIELSYESDSALPVDRLITLSTGSIPYSAETGEGIVTISDMNDMMLLSVALRGDAAAPNSLWLTERTTDDSLRLFRTRYGDRVSEVYEYNGRSYELSFSKEEIDAYNAWIGATPSRTDTPELTYSQILERGWDFSKFENLWDCVDRNGTLFGNTDGEILIGLIQNVDFVGWVKLQLGVANNSEREMPNWIMAICGGAALVATAKCPFGGPANPVCLVSGVVLGGCAILRLIDDVFGVF